MKIYKRFKTNRNHILYRGDCLALIRQIPDNYVDLTITSPPYCMGKEYEKTKKIEDFITEHKKILPEIVRITKDGGSICWQVGYHVNDLNVIPLDYIVYAILKEQENIYLKNRIIWTYGHGLHAKNRFSGRHEIILWFTKGEKHFFNLDATRIPQKYPGKKYYKGDKKGQYSGNPLGKNPSDVWDIPNVKARHVEKTEHPCQFPIALVQRLIKALCPEKGVILDPFIGSGTTGIAAIIEKKKFIGSEIKKKYYNLAWKRCEKAGRQELIFRPHDKSVVPPNPRDQVSKTPLHFIYSQDIPI
jgi:adenine-specific DNA-methyltransferase